jgi:hypothetical protein
MRWRSNLDLTQRVELICLVLVVSDLGVVLLVHEGIVR